jgi:formate hydrogenlyase subunit 6/NADH:ubiquinone oxidoreductase subunit I
MPDQITEKCTGCTLCTRYCPTQAIHGERKQRHTIDPHLCIECHACGRVCNFGAVQDRNGQPVTRIKPALWQQPTWDYSACVACNICVQACPTGVIGRLSPNGSKKKHAYPFLENRKGCIGCGFCASSCPVGAITMEAPEAQAEPTPNTAIA